MELAEVYTQKDFSGSLSKISEEKFTSLIEILNENILEEIDETAKDVLTAIDKDKIMNPDKPGSMPSNVINLFKQMSLNGRFSVGCYMIMKQWYESFTEGEEEAKEKPKKKEPPKKAKEVEEKIKEVRESEEDEGEEGSEEEETTEEEMEPEEPEVEEEEVIEEKVVEEPEEIKKEEEEPKPKLKAGEKIEEEKPKDKKKTKPKKKTKKEEQSDLLSIDPKNIAIYDITPKTHPDMFLELDGECISKRVIMTKSWKPNHPIDNQIPNELLRDIVNAFMDRWVTYADVMKMVDQMTCAYTSYTAKRIWWMVKYNEFIRYSLVKETRGYGDEAYRLVQRWVSHPMVSFALSEWNKVHKKK